jgi:hypothetical protein
MDLLDMKIRRLNVDMGAGSQKEAVAEVVASVRAALPQTVGLLGYSTYY